MTNIHLEIGLVERTTVAKIDIAMDSFTNINTTQEIWEGIQLLMYNVISVSCEVKHKQYIYSL